MDSISRRWTLILVAITAFSIVMSSVCMSQGVMPATRTSTAFQVSGDITRQSNIIPLSSGMMGNLLPHIPNLQFGFQYFFGDKVRSGQANADYLLPVNIGNDAVVYGEAHGNYWDFGRKPAGGASHRVDLSIGGGARKIYSNDLLLGINGFYDTSRLFNNWYSSGSVGLEMAANVGTSDAVDLNANWYGDLFSSNSILNAFRNKGGSYDLEAGYSHAMFNQAVDLRLKLAGYQFDTGNPVYGYVTGADLTTRDGMFTLRYEYGNDKINGSWNNIGGFVNVGFQMENIVKGESPFTAPEPIFKSPRNLRRMLTQKVKRDWNQSYAPGRAALASASVSGNPLCRTTPDSSNIDYPQATYYWVEFSPYFQGTDIELGKNVEVKFSYEFDVAPTTNGSFNVWLPFEEGGFDMILAPFLAGDLRGSFVLTRTQTSKTYTDIAIVNLTQATGPTKVSISSVTTCFNQ
jgi:hypothetical protein